MRSEDTQTYLSIKEYIKHYSHHYTLQYQTEAGYIKKEKEITLFEQMGMDIFSTHSNDGRFLSESNSGRKKGD